MPNVQGRILEHLRMPAIGGGEGLPYSVYLPPDYEASGRSYPVLYLLHGAGDDDSAWIHLGEIGQAMDAGIAAGVITPMLVAMPSGRRNAANDQMTFYVDDLDGGMRWADVFTGEFIPYFERTYRVRPEMNVRAIGGLSMGGFGALFHSLSRPGFFAATVALSPAVLTERQLRELPDDTYHLWFSTSLGAGRRAGERTSEHFRRTNPLQLMADMPAENLRKLRVFLDCGAEDDFRLDEGSFAMHRALRDKDVPHVFGIRQGDHSWLFWREGIKNGLAFVTEAFRN